MLCFYPEKHCVMSIGTINEQIYNYRMEEELVEVKLGKDLGVIIDS